MKKIVFPLLLISLTFGMCSPIFAANTTSDEAAFALYELGLFSGTGMKNDGTPNFDLDRSPTRHEAVTMLVRLLGKEKEALQGTWDIPFIDVADWAKPYVGYAYANGLAYGTGTDSFGGSNLVTASQYLTFVLRALGYDSSTDFKWDAAQKLSNELGITNGQYDKEGTFLRSDIAKISYNALNATIKGSDKELIQKLVDEEAVSGKAATIQGFDIYGWSDKVHFIYDIRTFTLYAFMNYTGYDDNNGRAISGVRKMVRDELADMNLKLSEPRYYATKEIDYRYYGNALRALGDAPNFTYKSTNVAPELSNLPQRLKEFYLAADIPTMFEKYRAQYEQELEAYKSALPLLVKMVSYLRVDVQNGAEIGIEVNLLDAYARGNWTSADDNPYYGFGIIRSGPRLRTNDNPNTLLILHEYAHGFSDPIIRGKLTQETNALAMYYDASSAAVKQEGYSGWEEIVCESFVRAFSAYFDSQGNRDTAVLDTNRGFTLTQYIYDRIPELSEFDGTIEDFMRMLLVEYPQSAQ